MASPVIDSIKVGVEALVVPPTAVWDLSADVATVWRAEALLVMVPTERVLHRATEAWHMETVLMLLIFHTEALVEGMFVLVAPVLQVNAEAVVSLGTQIMYVVIA